MKYTNAANASNMEVEEEGTLTSVADRSSSRAGPKSYKVKMMVSRKDKDTKEKDVGGSDTNSESVDVVTAT